MSEIIHPKFGLVASNDKPSKPTAPSVLPDDIFVVGDVAPDDFEKLATPIPEVAYGQTIVGTMTDEETVRFLTIQVLHDRYEILMKDATVNSLETASKSLRGYATVTDYMKALQGGEARNETMNDADLEKMYKMDALLTVRRASLFYDIQDRLSVFRFKIGIRSKRRVVTLDRKFQANE